MAHWNVPGCGGQFWFLQVGIDYLADQDSKTTMLLLDAASNYRGELLGAVISLLSACCLGFPGSPLSNHYTAL
jgi:hypothetical protein